MPLSTNEVVGSYAILEKLGEGGMGEVWKARDTRLGRIVALKCLPAERVSDQSRRKRFLQEAQAASALSHPNIVTIHDWIDHGDFSVLVMEYVPGKTLERLIRQGPLSLRDTLQYATQIAAALSAAHAAGIVHRDIKPGNIIVGERGRVKVLDFGLAKLSPRAEVREDEPTLTQHVETAEGLVAGSAPYMSPEQAEGKKVDARSDIFSFGAVLYEMVTGQRAFSGDTPASQMAAVLKTDPKPPSQINRHLPRELERIINRCLRKDLERRSQSMAEIKLALDEIKEESESGVQAVAAASPSTRPRWVVPVGIAGVALIAAVGWWASNRSTPTVEAPRYTIRRVTNGTYSAREAGVSPDGKLVVMQLDRGGQPDLWIQSLSGGEPVRLTNNPAAEFFPTFAHDGSTIFFSRSGSIHSIPPIGGTERTLATGPDVRTFAITPDSSQIFYTVGDPKLPYTSRRIFVVPASGGSARPVDLEPGAFQKILVSPDGKSILAAEGTMFGTVYNPGLRWRIAPARGGKWRDLEGVERLGVDLGIHTPVFWFRDGRVLTTAGGPPQSHMWAVPLTPDGIVQSAAVQLTNGTGEWPGMPSPEGRVIPFVNGGGITTLYEVQLDGKGSATPVQPKRLLQSDGTAFFPVFSGDGKKMVFVSSRMGNTDIWMRDFETGAEFPVVATSEMESRGSISPDGTKLAFQRTDRGINSTFWIPLPNGPETKVCDNCRSLLGWRPDSSGFLVSQGKPEHMAIYEVATGKLLPTAVHPQHEIHDLTFSPDGKWMAFKVVEPASQHLIYVSPYVPGRATKPSEWTRVSPDGFHTRPFWSRDGNALYWFRDGSTPRGRLELQRLDPGTKSVRGVPEIVASFRGEFRLAQPSLVGYGLRGNSVILPLAPSRVDLWIAQQEP
jgi:eukaryotic-like serine/threonine-protein kinase